MRTRSTDVPLTLSGADAADFNLTDADDDGTYELTFKQSPNYEAPADAGTDNVYNVTVVATDSDRPNGHDGRNRDGDQRR